MDAQLERVYARWCARSVLHLWDAPEVVRRWVDEGEEELRAVVWDAAGDAAGDAEAAATWAAARAAAWAAEMDAARDAARDAERDAVWAAAWDAGAAEGDAARDAARDAAEVKQARIRDLLDILPDLLRAHSLAARLLDDVRADPWLTREVVRALELPDLGVWCDWYKQMEDNQ